MKNPPPVIFICGTDTGVGKTTVAALLLALLREEGIDAAPMKPVETGCRHQGGKPVGADLKPCLAAAAMRPDKSEEALMAPYRFSLPAGPHLAARHERRRISTNAILDALERLKQRYRPVLVEGAGGLMVPLHGGFLTLDLLKQMRAPVILVARSGLGTINHSLLTLHALRNARTPVAGIVFNDGPDDDPSVAADNMVCIPRLGRTRNLGRIPFHPGIQETLKSAGRDPAALETLVPNRRKWIHRIIGYAK